MGLGIDPTNDYVFRLAFGSPANSDLLIHLLNAILDLPSPIVEVEILNPFLEQEFEYDKLAVLDIRAKDSTGRLLNVEMQTSLTAALRERLVYYAASLYAGQLCEGQSYAELNPTIGICILTVTMFPKVSAGHLRFVLSNVTHGVEFTSHFQIHTVELPKYNSETEDSGVSNCGTAGAIALEGSRSPSATTQLEKWALWFQQADKLDVDKLRRLLPEAPYQKAIGILEMISRTPSQRDLYEARQKAIRDAAWKLDEATKEARREGREAGLQEGREEGRQQGRQEGREVGLQMGREEGMRLGQIRLLQQLLSEPLSEPSEFDGLTLTELDERIAALQSRLQRR